MYYFCITFVLLLYYIERRGNVKQAITVRVDEEVVRKFKEYGKRVGIPAGALIVNFIHTTVLNEKHPTV